MPTYERSIIAKRLWNAQRELSEAIDTVDALGATDESASNTMGDDGEYIRKNTNEALRLCRSVALRLDREANHA